MNQQQFAIWLAELPSLTKQQLEELVTRSKLLSKTATKAHDGKSEFGLRVLVAICDTMKRNNVETPSPSSLLKSNAYVSSKGKLQDLEIFFSSIAKSKLTQDRILCEAIQLLYFDLLNWQGIAISSHTVLQQIHRIPATLNKHYPGYAMSGQLRMLVKGV